MEIKEAIREISSKLVKGFETLDKRYEECDASGHKSQNQTENRCNYCHRSLVYVTDADRILEERKRIPLFLHPLDAPILMDIRRRDLEHMTSMDKMYGLDMLAKEGLASSA